MSQKPEAKEKSGTPKLSIIQEFSVWQASYFLLLNETWFKSFKLFYIWKEKDEEWVSIKET